MKNIKLLASRVAQYAAGIGTVVMTSGAANAAIDLGDSTTAFSDGTVAAATLGGLGLAMVVGIRIFKKIRGAV